MFSQKGVYVERDILALAWGEYIMDGWVKLYRKSIENPVICKDTDHFAIWLYLLVTATHQEQSALFQGKSVTLLPGQLITGRKSISDKLKVSEYKVQRVLKFFETEQQIEQQTSNKKPPYNH